MLKRIIFDLDDTLIMWEDEYWKSLNNTLEKLNIEYNDEILKRMKLAVSNYEKEYNIYDEQTMKAIMEKYANIKLPNNFVATWIAFLKECYPKTENKELIEVLDYLSSKYELVVLTNWFTEQQLQRLENYNIAKYFKRVIGTDLVYNKPNKEAFLEACKPYKIEECLMIGDSMKVDIEGALKAGLKSIYFDYKNCYNGDILNVKTLKELKDIL